jgi:hypothetical protein
MARFYFSAILSAAALLTAGATPLWADYLWLVHRDTGKFLLSGDIGPPEDRVQFILNTTPIADRTLFYARHLGSGSNRLVGFFLLGHKKTGEYVYVTRKATKGQNLFRGALPIDPRIGGDEIDLRKVEPYLFELVDDHQGSGGFYVKSKGKGEFLRAHRAKDGLVEVSGKQVPKDDRPYRFDVFFPNSANPAAPQAGKADGLKLLRAQRIVAGMRRATLAGKADGAQDSGGVSLYVVTKRSGEFLSGMMTGLPGRQPTQSVLVTRNRWPKSRDKAPELFQVTASGEDGYVAVSNPYSGRHLAGPKAARAGDAAGLEVWRADGRERFEFDLVPETGGWVALQHRASGRYLRVKQGGQLTFGEAEIPPNTPEGFDERQTYFFDLLLPYAGRR